MLSAIKASQHPTVSFNQLIVPGFLGVCVYVCLFVFVCLCLSLFFIFLWSTGDLLRTGQDQWWQFLSCPQGKYNKPAASLSSSCGSVSLYCLLLSRFSVCTVNFLCLYALLLSFCSPVAFFLTFHSISECFIYFLFFLLFVLFSHGHAPYSVSFKWRPFCPPPPGHGYCSCGRCICEEGWFGKLCQFPRSCDMSDAQSKELCETSDGVMCSGKGEQAVAVGTDK